MTKTSKQGVALVRRLLDLARRQDRGALAALRTGQGKKPGEAARMFPIVAPYLHDVSGPQVETAFLIASLFASHPEHRDGVSMGAALHHAVYVAKKHGEEGVERRLAAALDADPEDLSRHLEGFVSLLASAGTSLDWHRFYWDVQDLLGDDEERRNRVRIRWARHFWKGSHDQLETEE